MVHLVALRKRSDFLRIASQGRSVATKGIVIQKNPTPYENNQGIRIGYTASRKTGNACLRNRSKRRLRALANHYLHHLGQFGHDYVLIARHTTPTRNWKQLCKDMQWGLHQLTKIDFS